MADLISVIVTTWNREDALDAVLRSLSVQTDRDFEVIVADGGTDLYNPNAIRASLGAIFTVPTFAVRSEAALQWLKRHRFRMFAARVDGSIVYTAADFTGPTALALGSEAHGLSKTWHAPDIHPIRVPLMGTVDSLNLSATAAILFYEAHRQRSTSPGG